MKLNRTFYLVAITALALSPIFLVNAQQTPLVQNLPQIHVTDLTIPQRTLNAGDLIKGTFTLFNNSQTNAPDVSYLVALVGDFKNNLPGKIYDQKKMGEIFLSAGEKKNVNFSYQLPESVAGNKLGIRVQTMFAGLYMGWSDAMIFVAGASLFADVTSAKLVINGKDFAPEAGPVVPKAGTISYQVKFRNPTKQSLTFIPNVRVYNRLLSGELLKEFSGERVVLAAGQSTSINLSLPTFDYKPLVYAGEVRFLDDGNNPVAPTISFRYIIFGDMATIQTVAVDKTSLVSGETAKVSVFYLPPPFDQFTGEVPKVGEADLTVTLLNEKNSPVGTASQKIDLDSNNTSAVLMVTATAKAKALSALAIIAKDGVELSRYGANLSPTAENGVPAESGDWAMLAIWLVIGITALIIGGILWTVMKNKKQGSNLPPASPPAPPTIPTQTFTGPSNLTAALLIVGVALAASLGISAIKVSAFTTTDSYSPSPLYLPDIFVSSPYEEQTIAAGSPFNLQVSEYFGLCANLVYADITWTITLNGITNTYNYPLEVVGEGEYWYYSSNQYSFPLTAPSTPGVYNIVIKDNHTLTYLSGSGNAWREGYITINVVSPLPPPVVVDPPTEGAGGGSGGTSCLDDIKLDWSAVTGADKYEIYRDGTILAEVNSPTTTYTDSSATAGAHTYYIVAVSGISRSAPSNEVSATKCANAPSVTLTPNPNPAVANQDTVTWTAIPSGGSCGEGNYTFDFVGGDIDPVTKTGSSATLTHKYHDPGSYPMMVTVSKSGCATVVQNSVVVVNPQNLSDITCEPSPKIAAVNQNVIWTAVPNPDGDYTYSWSGDNGLSGSTKSITKSYGSPGIYRATVEVTGVGNSSCSSEVNVKINPDFQEF